MCGIAGIVSIGNPKGASEAAVREMTSRLRHRGPDGEGFRFQDFMGFGHRRLSVIDVEGGAQPMSNEDGSIWIVYNGEIYNFAEISKELKDLGHKFATRCDTEVIVHAYEQWGFDCLSRFNGMFAFAVWDSGKKRLFMARDRLGIKPLFYAKTAHGMAFASELRALLPALASKPGIDPFGLTSYFLTQYVPAPCTMLEDVEKMEPAHAAVFDESGFRKWRWWSPPAEDGVTPLEGAGERLRELIEESVRSRLISDVPLGAFLSGGIDSSTVVGMMARNADEPVRTFQVAFEDPPGYDETLFAVMASEHFGARHERIVMKPSDLAGLLPSIAKGMGEPVADPAVIPTYMVSKLARRFVTVVLTGEGADELFGGYLRYSLDRLGGAWSMVPEFARKAARGIFSILPRTGRILKAMDALDSEAGAERHLAWTAVLPRNELASLLPDVDVEKHIGRLLGVFGPYFEPATGNTNPLGKTLRCDVGTWLPDDLLAKVDYMSMAHGLEARVPFLDHRVVEWALALPNDARIKGLKRKVVLKDAATGLAPKKIIERGKWGFTLPLDQWFRGALKDFMKQTVQSASKVLPIDGTTAGAWVDEHSSGAMNRSPELFSLMMAALWAEGLG